MQSKLRVVHYCNQLSLGGTERTMELFCKHLDREKFEVFAVAKRFRPTFAQAFRVYFGLLYGHKLAWSKFRLWKQMNARIPNLEAILGRDHVKIVGGDEELRRVLLELRPDILHIHYSGMAEAPITFDDVMAKTPKVFTTNQFEIENTSPNHARVKKMFFVSKWLLETQAKWALKDPRAEVMPNPVEEPLAKDDMRAELGIPKDAFVIGRVGRADPGIHDPISLKAYAKIQNECTWFLALSPPSNMLREAKELGLKNFVAIPYISDETKLSRFYNTIDVLAHARKDGETFGCNLAEAMVHGKPCVSHLTDAMNAQVSTIADGGTVVAKDDVDAYARELARLQGDLAHYKDVSARARAKSHGDYTAATLTRRLEKAYLS